MRPLEKIKQGIQEGSFVLIAEGYSDMTGDYNVNIPTIGPIANNTDIIHRLEDIISILKKKDIESLPEIPKNKPKTTAKKNSVKKPKEKDLDKEVEHVLSNVQLVHPKSSGQVTEKTAMLCPTEDLTDEAEQEANKKIVGKIPKSKRPSPKSISCSLCKSTISNPSKYVERTNVESSMKKVKCPHCRDQFECKI